MIIYKVVLKALMRASSIIIPQCVQEIIAHLHIHHFQAFVIGGCVRDNLLGKTPKDWDIATDATPKQIQAIFAKSYKLITLGARYGTIGIITNTPSAFCVEITTFRLESSYINSRHPSNVSYTTDLLQDLKRRDFTCNALAYNPYLPTLPSSTPNAAQNEVLKLDANAYALYHRYMPYIRDGVCDYVGGLADIATRTLRCVGDANARFSEDALRILRALRFQAQLGFSIESSAQAALFANVKKLSQISAQRKQEEWSKILCAKHLTNAIIGFGAVWAEVFREFAKPLIALDSSPSAQMLTTLATLESINTSPHLCINATSLESIHIDSALSLRLSLWFYALDSSLEQATKSLQALGYKSRIISLCQTLLSHANLPSPQSLESTRILARDIGLDSLALVCEFIALIYDEHYAAPLQKHLATIHAQKLCYNLATLALNGNDLTAIADSMGVMLQGRVIGKLLRTLLNEVICSNLSNTKDALYARAKELIQAI